MDTVNMLNKMSFYCQPILPLVYDESMSYYETLCKVVGQLNTTGETVNKLNEGLTGEISDRQAADAALDERLTGEISDRRDADAALNNRLTGEIADRLNADSLLNERLKVVEATNNKIHFLAFAGTPPHNARPVGAMPTRSELRQWINDRDMIVTVMETNDEERNQVYATSCTYNAVNWTHETPSDFYIIVPISTDYGSEGDNSVRQKIAKITIPPDSASSLNDDWGLQIIEINTPFNGGKIEGSVEITGGLKVGMSAEFSSSIKAGSEISSDMLLMAPIVALHDPATEESISFGVSGENAAKVTSDVSGGGVQYARLKVASPTEDNDAATKKYVDDHSAATVDTALSDTSTNPVQNKVITGALDGKASTAVASQTANGLMSKRDKTKLDGIEDGANKTIVDEMLSAGSTNPVQNKTVTSALDSKLPKTGGTVTGALRTNDSFSAGGTIAFGEAPIGLSQTADGAAQIRYGSAGVDGNPPPLARVKVARPTADDDAATKKYVDDRNNSPQFKGYVTLTPANAPLGTGVGLSPSGSGNDFTLDISDVNADTPTLLTGVKTPNDTNTNAAATVEYVNAKVASGGSSDFVVNATINSDRTVTLDKTFTQIRKAALDGKSVLMSAVSGGSHFYFPLLTVAQNICIFEAPFSNENSIEVQSIRVSSNDVVTPLMFSAPVFNSDGALPQATMSSDPTSPMQIATKKYVDDRPSGAPITIKLGTGNAATSTATFAEIKAALEAGKAPILDSAPGTNHWFALNWTLSGTDRLTIQYGTFNVEGGGTANFTIYDVSVSSTGITCSSRQFTTE